MRSSSASPPEKGMIRGGFSFFGGMFTKHLAVKFAALVFALLLWFSVRRDLLATLKGQPVEVKVELAGGLMLTEPRPTIVKMDFQGPTSQISLLKRQELFIRLPVERDDLLGQLQATLVFSPERGNLEHGYGSEVKILAMDPPEIRLAVAVEGRRKVEVQRPTVELTAPEWTVQVDLVSPEVELKGPRAVLESTQSFVPAPIDGDAIVARLPPNEEEVTVERLLTLPAALRASQVEVASGQDAFRVKLTFRREGDQRNWSVPFRIFLPPDAKSDLRIYPKGDLITAGEDGGYELEMTFRGTPRNLEQLEQAVSEGHVYAYVLADEFSFWVEDKPNVGSAPPEVHVRIPEDLWGKVSPVPPDRRMIFLVTERKE